MRIWGNYLHHVVSGVGLATVSQGPVYAFRNILGDTAGMTNPNGANKTGKVFLTTQGPANAGN